MAGVGAFQHDDPFVPAQFPGELAAAHVHGVDPRRAAAQQHVREAPGGGAHVQAHQPLRIDAEVIEPVGQLDAAPGRPRVAAPPDVQARVLGEAHPGFVQPPGAAVDQPGHDQGAGAASAVGETALDEQLIQAFLFRRGHAASLAPRLDRAGASEQERIQPANEAGQRRRPARRQ